MNTWHGIEGDEITWHPTVVAERCVGCGLCVTSCGRRVYAFDYERNLPVVIAANACMVGCTTCATLCVRDAIEFPLRGYARDLVRQHKLLRKSKGELLRDRPELDVARIARLAPESAGQIGYGRSR